MTVCVASCVFGVIEYKNLYCKRPVTTQKCDSGNVDLVFNESNNNNDDADGESIKE